MLIVAGGMAVGLAASLALAPVVASLLYGVGAGDLVTFEGVSILLAVVASVACYLPAWRASRVDPLLALRYE